MSVLINIFNNNCQKRITCERKFSLLVKSWQLFC